jgi:hypothetical protein
MGGNTSQQPMTPEEKMQTEREPIEELENEEQDYNIEDDTSQDLSDDEEPDIEEPTPDNEDDDSSDRNEYEEDEYGNQKERMSKGMKDRLDRKEKQIQREREQYNQEINALRAQLAQQGASHEVQQAAKDFEYNPDGEGDWQQQLAQFVRHEVKSMARNEEAEQARQRDAQVQEEFERKFAEGMNKFDDFREVIRALPCEISNPMTLATRSMDNPAAFFYAAAKRRPQELERISKLRDPYGQMMEMGKLEERMRRNKPTTKAPRPLGRVAEDATGKVKPKEKDSSGDDLLARADSRRLASVKQRHRSNR